MFQTRCARSSALASGGGRSKGLSFGRACVSEAIRGVRTGPSNSLNYEYVARSSAA